MHCARLGHETILWSREQDTTDAINTLHENVTYFKGHKLPESLRACSDKHAAIAGAAIILLVVPTPAVEEVVKDLAMGPTQILVSCTKGILNDTLETPNEIIQRVLPALTNVAFLSGPSFAKEVAENQPTAVTIASTNESVAVTVQQALSGERFRCYRSHDVVGVELGGALKNVLAIATGISDGLGFGCNARAFLITRGLAEMNLLSVRSGADPLTLAGLSGVGDVILTCTSTLSRNYTVGYRLGKGEKLDEIIASLGAVAEGVKTSRSAHELAVKLGVEVPVITGIYRVIHLGEAPLQVLHENMSRPLREETML